MTIKGPDILYHRSGDFGRSHGFHGERGGDQSSPTAYKL